MKFENLMNEIVKYQNLDDEEYDENFNYAIT
jgi:hypothetical protein